MKYLLLIFVTLAMFAPASAQESDMIYRMNSWTYNEIGRGTRAELPARIKRLFRYQWTLAGHEPPNEVTNYSQGRLQIPMLVFEFDVYGDRVVYFVRAGLARRTIPQQYEFYSMAARGYGDAADIDSLVIAAAKETLQYLGLYEGRTFAIIGGMLHNAGMVQAVMPPNTDVAWVTAMGETVATSNVGASGSTAFLQPGVYFVFATNRDTGERVSHTIVVRGIEGFIYDFSKGARTR